MRVRIASEWENACLLFWSEKRPGVLCCPFASWLLKHPADNRWNARCQLKVIGGLPVGSSWPLVRHCNEKTRSVLVGAAVVVAARRGEIFPCYPLVLPIQWRGELSWPLKRQIVTSLTHKLTLIASPFSFTFICLESGSRSSWTSMTRLQSQNSGL